MYSRKKSIIVTDSSRKKEIVTQRTRLERLQFNRCKIYVENYAQHGWMMSGNIGICEETLLGRIKGMSCTWKDNGILTMCTNGDSCNEIPIPSERSLLGRIGCIEVQSSSESSRNEWKHYSLKWRWKIFYLASRSANCFKYLSDTKVPQLV